MNRQTKGFLLVIISAVGFGSMPVFARLGYQAGANMFELLTARFLVAGLVLTVYLNFRKVRPLTGRERFGAIIMGLCGYGLATFCFFSSLERISAPLTSIIFFTYPALVCLMLLVSKKEKPDRFSTGALVLSFSGLVLVLGSSLNTVNPLGSIFALAAALLFSFYVLLGDRFLRDAPLSAATALISWAAAAGFGSYGVLTGQLNFNFGFNGWLAVAALALFSTVISIFCFLQGVIIIGPSRASIVSTLEPPVTVVLAGFFLSEILGPWQFFGGVLVLASAVLVNFGQRSHPVQPSQSAASPAITSGE